MAHEPPQFREPGSKALPYGLALGVSVQAEFTEDDDTVTNMAVDGSTTPVFFGVSASTSAIAFHTFQIIIRTAGRVVFPDLFGDQVALTNGLQIILRDTDRNSLGSFPSTTIKNNGDWYLFGPEYVTYDIGMEPTAGSAVAIQFRTQPSEDALVLLPGQSLGILVDDDLTGLVSMRAVAFGRNLSEAINRTDS